MKDLWSMLQRQLLDLPNVKGSGARGSEIWVRNLSWSPFQSKYHSFAYNWWQWQTMRSALIGFQLVIIWRVLPNLKREKNLRDNNTSALTSCTSPTTSPIPQLLHTRCRSIVCSREGKERKNCRQCENYSLHWLQGIESHFGAKYL
jgi:hypothetical protein